MNTKILKWAAAAMIGFVAIALAADITFGDLNPTDTDSYLVLQQKVLAAINANTTAVNANGGGGSQSPWTGDINGGGHALTNVVSIDIGNGVHTNGSSTIFGATQDVGYTLTNNADGNYRESLPGSGLSGPYLKLYAGSNVTSVALSTYVAPAFTALTDGTTITWTVDGTKAVQNGAVMLAGNRTLAFSGLAAGMTGTLLVKQDGTGSRTLALPGSSKVISGGSGAVTLTTTASAIDVLTWAYDGTNTYWNIGKNYN